MLFGSSTKYHEAEQDFFFTAEGRQVSGYTIELIEQEGGNLDTRRIGANEF